MVYISIAILDMTIIQADALDSTTHIPSPLMGEDKGEGDNWSGWSWAPGLLERPSCFVIARGFPLCHCKHFPLVIASISPFVIASEAKQSLSGAGGAVDLDNLKSGKRRKSIQLSAPLRFIEF